MTLGIFGWDVLERFVEKDVIRRAIEIVGEMASLYVVSTRKKLRLANGAKAAM